MTAKLQARPPKHLAKATKHWFKSVVNRYNLTEEHIRLLTLAAEARDRAEQAREILAVEGIQRPDRFGIKQTHPCVSIERDSRISYARLMRELNLKAGTP